MNPTPITLRRGAPDDAGHGAHVAFEAFRSIAERHDFPPDFESPEMAGGLLSHLLSRPDVHAVVAERDGRMVGSNFLWESDAIAGVGPVTVDPEAQDDAIGRRLMEAVLRRAAERGFKGVRLVQAAYHNRSFALYSKLGFDVREPLSLLQGAALDSRLPDRFVRQALLEDLPACRALGAQVLGAPRLNELRGALAEGTATVVEHDGRISGYTTGIGFFGHAVARHNDDLKALIGAAPRIAGMGLLLPSRNAELLRWCLQHGLRIVQPMTLMSLGEYVEPRGVFLPSILY